MKLLKSNLNEFPQFYAEYAVEDLGIFMHKLPKHFLPVIEEDIKTRGMVHPITIFSPYEEHQTDPNPDFTGRNKHEVLRVYMGHKRVWVAKKLGYTHISAYHVRTYEDAHRMCGVTTIREFCPN